jgi:PKD repeat protein
VHRAPTALVISRPVSPVINQAVTLDGSRSSDDGSIAKYEWDLNGDNTFETTTTVPTTTTVFATTGAKRVGLRVTDNDGLTATAHVKVAVGTAGGNLPPVAQVAGSPPEGEIPLLVTWDASGSFDFDGTIAKYEWDMDQDPTGFEWDSGTTPTMEITYYTGGPHTQYVRVTDDGGLTDMAFGVVHMIGGN